VQQVDTVEESLGPDDCGNAHLRSLLAAKTTRRPRDVADYLQWWVHCKPVQLTAFLISLSEFATQTLQYRVGLSSNNGFETTPTTTRLQQRKSRLKFANSEGLRAVLKLWTAKSITVSPSMKLQIR
jgi:hypothetical protein